MLLIAPVPTNLIKHCLKSALEGAWSKWLLSGVCPLWIILMLYCSQTKVGHLISCLYLEWNCKSSIFVNPGSNPEQRPPWTRNRVKKVSFQFVRPVIKWMADSGHPHIFKQNLSLNPFSKPKIRYKIKINASHKPSYRFFVTNVM